MSILITGGTKGIGRAIALAFAEPGVDVFLNYAGDDDAAGEAPVPGRIGGRALSSDQAGCRDAGGRAERAGARRGTSRATGPARALRRPGHSQACARLRRGRLHRRRQPQRHGAALPRAGGRSAARARQHRFLPHKPGRTHRGAQLRRHRRRQSTRGIAGALSRKRARAARHPHQLRRAGRGPYRCSAGAVRRSGETRS